MEALCEPMCFMGILRGGAPVAIKVLSAESRQGVREFLTEIETVTNVKHPNLVEIIGCCVQQKDRILVYEYVENNSLDRALLTPEYAMGGQLTKKADVYSFGVLLIEIISGRSSAKENWGGAERHALEWVWHLHKEGRLLELVDTELVQYPEDEVLRYLKIALFCTQAAASRRPQMTQVVEMLSRDVRLNEKELTVPGYFQDSTKNSSGSASSSNKNMVSDISSEPVSYFPSAITQVNAR
ncbi:hypothetical protein Scep_011269 [Stephania cephalantha]|uniref:Serine-threonine/tyrosine-protein kinase catalytic domain-containing protein n=1 Tax=Stephania cephalantha TaxID=152367 RepID=A0AAP0P8R4_9MAGN